MAAKACKAKQGPCACADCCLARAKCALICAQDRLGKGEGSASELDQVNALITLLGGLIDRRDCEP